MHRVLRSYRSVKSMTVVGAVGYRHVMPTTGAEVAHTVGFRPAEAMAWASGNGWFRESL